MTDKQIIIDDVDVSGCGYGEIEKSIFKCSCEYNVRSASMFCKDNPNCYYKKLKRKEQECEELKKINKANAKSYEKHWYKLEKYKAILAEIKEIAEKIEDECGYLGCGSCANEAKEQILQKISEVE